jgi:hypothetical protein
MEDDVYTPSVEATSLSAFLAQNVKKPEKRSHKPSDRFTQPFEIGIISGTEYQKLRSRCMKMVPAPDHKRGSFTQDFDPAQFQLALCARCTLVPDLNSAALQDSYDVRDAETLIGTMLMPGELEDYFNAILKANGFKDTVELVEEAKN